MNKKNNMRKKKSQEKIEKVFLELIQDKEINEITVTDICEKTKLNRSTFYANYLDIYDLVEKIKENMLNTFFSLYKDEVNSKSHSYNFLKLFYHIKENQLFYKTYFKLNLDLSNSIIFIDNLELSRFYLNKEDIDYHIEFFKAGLNAIIKKWLNTNCRKSPIEINEILKSEYKDRIKDLK